MTKNSRLTQKDFDALLLWLSSNREEAGVKYEGIRNGLIHFFHYKGCSEAESLADETINRVAQRLSTLVIDKDKKHITYFYGFAAKIHLEYLHDTKKREIQFEQNLHSTEEKNKDDEDFEETRHKCLEKCLAKIAPEDKELAIEYFSKDKSEKFEHRRKLAEQMNINMGAMHVRIHRLKKVLKDCIEKCLKEN